MFGFDFTTNTLCSGSFVQKFHSAARSFHSKWLAQFIFEIVETMGGYNGGCNFKRTPYQGSPELSISYIFTIILLHIGIYTIFSSIFPCNILEKPAKELIIIILNMYNYEIEYQPL